MDGKHHEPASLTGIFAGSPMLHILDLHEKMALSTERNLASNSQARDPNRRHLTMYLAQVSRG